MAQFTLYWKDGKRDVVKGRNTVEAMTLAGYGGGAVGALDMVANGNDHAWYWNTDVSPARWDRVPAGGIGLKPANTGQRRARA